MTKTELLLDDYWQPADWLTDCWLIDWSSHEVSLKIWARKMKIESSRQTWTEQTDKRTNGRRKWLLELLSEPKIFYYRCISETLTEKRVLQQKFKPLKVILYYQICPMCYDYILEQRVHPRPGQVWASVQGGGGGFQRVVHQNPYGQETVQDTRGWRRW